jgi:glycosyltransferase involved in cell wall biosynthesis
VSKKVYVEPNWRMHSGIKAQFISPPEGYEFVLTETFSERTAKLLIKSSFSYFVREQLNKVLPPVLVRAYVQKFKSPPVAADLTYAIHHLPFRKDPWVIELENVCNLTESNSAFLRRYRGFFERKLASPYCKKIIVWSDVAFRSIELNLDCSTFGNKMGKVPYATTSKDGPDTPAHGGETVKLLFVNSANLQSNFRLKGGVEVLEAFSILGNTHPNLQLVIRSDVPEDVKRTYSRMRNVQFIEEVLPFAVLEKEYQSCDVFLAPGYMMAVWAILDAMSYGLPVVATDIACAGEYVEDGRTGLVINNPQQVPCYEKDLFLPPLSKLRTSVKRADSNVVQDLVKALSILIESPQRRQEMGRAGRREVEHGRFSIARRNDKLKRILDEATS